MLWSNAHKLQHESRSAAWTWNENKNHKKLDWHPTYHENTSDAFCSHAETALLENNAPKCSEHFRTFKTLLSSSDIFHIHNIGKEISICTSFLKIDLTFLICLIYSIYNEYFKSCTVNPNKYIFGFTWQNTFLGGPYTFDLYKLQWLAENWCIGCGFDIKPKSKPKPLFKSRTKHQTETENVILPILLYRSSKLHLYCIICISQRMQGQLYNTIFKE